MTSKEGQTLVLVSGVTIVGIESLKNLLNGNGFSSRELIGAGIAFTVLSGMAEVAPGPAGMLAATAMVTVLLADASPVITGLVSSRGTSSSKQQTKKGNRTHNE